MPALDLAAFFFGNNNRLLITNARSQLEAGGIIDAATGTAQLLDKDMEPISDAIALTPLVVAGSYEAIFPYDAPLALGQFVNVLILLDGGPSLKYRGVINAKVQENIE